MIPDDEHKLITAELEATYGPSALPTWEQVDLVCRELRYLREVDIKQRELISHLQSRLAAKTRPRDYCAGRMERLEDTTYRCVRCGNERTEYGPPTACGAAIYY